MGVNRISLIWGTATRCSEVISMTGLFLKDQEVKFLNLALYHNISLVISYDSPSVRGIKSPPWKTFIHLNGLMVKVVILSVESIRNEEIYDYRLNNIVAKKTGEIL